MDRDIVKLSTQSFQEFESDGARFDESMFPPRDEHFDEYAQDVRSGYGNLSNRRVVITGLARDVAQVLPLTIQRMEHQGQFFADYRVVIYENDSQDNTLDLLNDWARRNHRVLVVSEKRDDPVNQPTRCLSRAERMAYYRSQCQATIRKEFNRFDNVIIVDTDLIGGWSYDGMAHTFSRGGWDFVGANGIIYRRLGLRPNAYVQYDAWAYRTDKAFTPLDTKTVNYMLYERGEALQPVHSCFGGVGVYAMKPYLTGVYDGSDVEHVSFHKDLYEKGHRRIFMNPSLIALYGRKHRSFDGPVSRFISLRDRLLGWPDTKWHFETDPVATEVETTRRDAA